MNKDVYRNPKKTTDEFRSLATQKIKGRRGLALGALLLVSILGGNVFTFDFEVEAENVQDAVLGVKDFILNLQSSSAPAWFVILGALQVALVGLVTSIAFAVLIGSPIAVGYEKFNLDLITDGADQPKIATLFRYFSPAYGKTIAVRLLTALIDFACQLPLLAALALTAVFNWESILHWAEGNISEADVQSSLVCYAAILAAAILTVVLRIVIGLRFRYAATVLSEYPEEMNAIDALRNSANMMNGNKWRLFLLELSYIGWYILSAFTCGILLLWILPHNKTAVTLFYDEVSHRSEARDVEFPSLDFNDYDPDGNQF